MLKGQHFNVCDAFDLANELGISEKSCDKITSNNYDIILWEVLSLWLINGEGYEKSWEALARALEKITEKDYKGIAELIHKHTK